MPGNLPAIILMALVVCAPPAQTPAPTAGDIPDAAILHFIILDPARHPIPGRLTFHTAADPRPNLFPNADADPNRLAVRQNVIYTINGTGTVTVPPGTYTLITSRGLEWSIDTRTITLSPGQTTDVEATLTHEVDTTGWISGDFHLHTLTHSGHGDSNMPERIISLVGEGVEFAVATDHNHHTNYQPTMHVVGADPMLTSVTGNEVTTSFGHFNAFPLEPGHDIPYLMDGAKPLFALIREERNRFGVTPVIQVNHPRWADIDYFDHAALDPVTAESHSDVWSDDFDTIEVFNENAGWGYFDPDDADHPTGNQTFSVLRDWFNLLNRGHRYTAVGNSDSHHVEYVHAGYPRNFVASPTDDPSRIDPADVAGALRASRSFTTIGPFVQYSVNDQPMGSNVSLDSLADPVRVHVRVAAASWIDCDLVKIVVNGDVIHTIDVPDTRDIQRLDTTWTFTPGADAWLAVLVEGDDPLTAVVHDQARPVYPIAVTNPVWIDADADGTWTSPYEQALQRVITRQPAESLARAPHPADRALAVQAAAELDAPSALDLVQLLLHDEDRFVRLSAARAAERLADPALIDPLRAALAGAQDDHARVALLRALARAGDPAAPGQALDMLATSQDPALQRRFGADLAALLPATPFVQEWMAVGFFECPDRAAFLDTDYGPETDRDAVRLYAAKTGPTRWQPIDATPEGYVDLTTIESRPDIVSDAVTYLQAWLNCPEDRDVSFAFGADDGARLWINDRIVYEENGSHAASPVQHLDTVTLTKGANRVLVKVRNGSRDYGIYFRVFDPEVTATRTPTPP